VIAPFDGRYCEPLLDVFGVRTRARRPETCTHPEYYRLAQKRRGRPWCSRLETPDGMKPEDALQAIQRRAAMPCACRR